MNLSQWLQLLISGITTGMIYALVGLGYVTIYRTSRVVNFAQGSFVMLGALITYSLLSERGPAVLARRHPRPWSSSWPSRWRCTSW